MAIFSVIVCMSGGCKAKVNFSGAISFVAAYDGCPENTNARLMGIAYACPKCGRLYNSNGSPLQYKSFNAVFLDKEGRGVVKNSREKVVHTFWTSESEFL
jgi:hypothetical protein